MQVKNLSNLVKAPKCANAHGLVTMGSKSGTMDHDLVCDYLNRVVFPYSESIGRKLLIFWDDHGSHWKEDVVALVKERGHELVGIPARTTSYLQPLDVSANAPFKRRIKEQYETWLARDDLALT